MYYCFRLSRLLNERVIHLKLRSHVMSIMIHCKKSLSCGSDGERQVEHGEHSHGDGGRDELCIVEGDVGAGGKTGS